MLHVCQHVAIGFQPWRNDFDSQICPHDHVGRIGSCQVEPNKMMLTLTLVGGVQLRTALIRVLREWIDGWLATFLLLSRVCMYTRPLVCCCVDPPPPPSTRPSSLIIPFCTHC
eukprot:m.175588 g.175588  ORF g.175588 m.175588 type:complete len:113 (-) comp14023_c0_seq1:43-381(-)